MTIKKTIGRIAAGAIATLAIAGAAAPAFAHSANQGGASSWNSGRTFYVKDTDADSHSVYGNWAVSGGSGNDGRLDNSSGYNTTVSKDVNGDIISVRACVNIQWGTDDCSGWY
ncbi:hypothetical protein [Kitasatospora cheerisanensis]|uniref:Uncharacterized protein n=1 Tax=Kitasatospora cheerisanensis KCTC 2395 TaxID=1348663 RepID=A0A066Z2K7_9ACTN|nr:hypothetical protein [Kitasatospora cheerisanensis]KDN84415.1 hypothetical protein KCH_42060 [Kitasatospora cheerisanensis KCTC 2395]